MNILKVSKFLLQPTLLILIFVSGVIIALIAKFNFLPIIVGSMLAAIILIVFKKPKYSSLLIALSIGYIYTSFFIFVTMRDAPLSQCLTGFIKSQINSYSEGKYRFAFTAGQERYVIESSDAQELGYQDKIEVCPVGRQYKDINGRANYYLANYLSDKVIAEPRIKYLERGRGIKRSLFDFSDYLSRNFYHLWPGDRGVLAKGLILGGSQDFTDEIGQALKNSGTSHLTAVSGYNIAIITVVFFNLLRLISKKLAFAITLVMLLSFVFLTGMTPSVMRAALMGGTYLLSKMMGRPKTTMHFLMLAGLVLVLTNPFILYNVGFLLSFAATYGLILAGNLVSDIASSGEKGALKTILATLYETTVAQIFVLPILLYYFGQISILAPISNLLILPIIPLAMLLEAAAVLFNFINGYLAILFAKFVEPVLSYILFMIKLFGPSEYAVIKTSSFSILLIIIFYIGLHLALYLAGRQIKKNKLAEVQV